MSALKKKSETCEEQLRRMCKSIANSISEPQQITDEETGEKREETTHDWMEDVYDIEWITHRDHSYKAARLLVAGGGPTIWVNLLGNTVDGYWWGDTCKVPFSDNLGLDDYLEELHPCQ
jgi:hypothetical protein